MSDIAGSRIAYNDRTSLLLEDSLPVKEPIALFGTWYDEMKTNPNVIEPQAMCLATATKDGIPSARFVLCKGFGKDGFRFFTHYTSRKGQELDENPNAAATFYWAPFNRSVRVEGKVEQLPMHVAEEYFSKRPYDSQIGALCSNQSKPIKSRSVLIDKERELKSMHKEGEVPKPEKWGGYLLIPTSIEFWQGQTDRIHDRIKFYAPETGKVADEDTCFSGENGWVYERLSP